jgi:hypothetical protein
MMLEQYEALVQPTPFIELLRKTMPMSEAQLDMFTTMHDSMFRRLNALEMLHEGGQRAVDEFTAFGLHGLEKRKANALQKAKQANPNDGSGGGNGNPARRRARQARGGMQDFLETRRHPPPKRPDRPLAPSTSSSNSRRGLNVENATKWATGRKTAAQVSSLRSWTCTWKDVIG